MAIKEQNIGYNIIDKIPPDYIDSFEYTGNIELKYEYPEGAITGADLLELNANWALVDGFDVSDVLYNRPFLIYNSEADSTLFFSMGLTNQTQVQFTDLGVQYYYHEGEEQDEHPVSRIDENATTGYPMLLYVDGSELTNCYHTNTILLKNWYNQDLYVSRNGEGETVSYNVPIFNSRKDTAKLYKYLVTGQWDDKKEEDSSSTKPSGNTNDPKDDPGDNEPHEPDAQSIAIAGACNCYVATPDQVKSFFFWFWHTMTEEIKEDDWFKQVLGSYGDLRKNIVSVRRYPFRIPRGEVERVVLGRFRPENLSYPKLAIGRSRICRYSGKVPKSDGGSFIDYNYTDVYLYLPYYGVITLPTEEVMARTINVDYYVDYSTGGLDIFVMIEKRLLTHLTAQVGANVFYDLDSGYSTDQLMGNFKTNIKKTSISTALGALGGIAGGPVGAAAGVVAGAIGAVPDLQTSTDSIDGTLPSNDNISCFNEDAMILLSIPEYLDIEQSGQDRFKGWCIYKELKLSDDGLSGFTQCENPTIKYGKTKNSDGIVIMPSKEEQDKIKELLSGGVYL